MAWEARLGLKLPSCPMAHPTMARLNGLGSPSGIETIGVSFTEEQKKMMAKWPGKPVWD